MRRKKNPLQYLLKARFFILWTLLGLGCDTLCCTPTFQKLLYPRTLTYIIPIPVSVQHSLYVDKCEITNWIRSSHTSNQKILNHILPFYQSPKIFLLWMATYYLIVRLVRSVIYHERKYLFFSNINISYWLVSITKWCLPCAAFIFEVRISS